ncbi:CHAT domain-containing protein [Trichothermofontia sp.]
MRVFGKWQWLGWLLVGWLTLSLTGGVYQAVATAPAVAPRSAPSASWEISIRQSIATLLQSPHPSQAQLQQALAQAAQLHEASLTPFPAKHQPGSPQPVATLDPTAAILYPIVLPDRLAVIAALPNQPLFYHASASPQAEVVATLRQFRQSLNPVYPDALRLQVSQQLYDWLIRPFRPTFEQAHIKTLVFTLDAPLRDLPMAALHDGQHYLVEQYQLALAPSRALLPATPWTDIHPVTLLAAGLSAARQGFPALPNVLTELAAITTYFPAHTLVNEEFTEVALAQALQDHPAPIVHIASHAQSGLSSNTSFILAWEHKIWAANLKKLIEANVRRSTIIELLVLSACQTASGDQRAALGLAGLAVRSGVRSVVATLWAVSDRSTAEFMAVFYQHLMQGLDRSRALRQAQLNLLQSQVYEHPYYWAPFILVGDWR